MPQHIVVRPYNPEYPSLYKKEALLLKSILGSNLLMIEHIGSTAVPSLLSKPIIDILISVRDLSLVDEKKEEFIANGYEYLGEYGIKNRRYLRKGGDERTHQVHIFPSSSSHVLFRHICVRDYLLSHPQKAKEYGDLKRGLAIQYPYDIEAYCDGKETFMKELENLAFDWYQERIFLRKYQEKDLSSLIRLFQETVTNIPEADYSFLERKAWSENIFPEKWNKSLKEHLSYVALLEGKIVGFADMAFDGYFDRLYVAKDYQGRGIATLLLKRLESEIKGPYRVEASISALSFFIKHGYRIVKEQKVLRNNVYLRNFQMKKD